MPPRRPLRPLNRSRRRPHRRRFRRRRVQGRADEEGLDVGAQRLRGKGARQSPKRKQGGNKAW